MSPPGYKPNFIAFIITSSLVFTYFSNITKTALILVLREKHELT